MDPYQTQPAVSTEYPTEAQPVETTIMPQQAMSHQPMPAAPVNEPVIAQPPSAVLPDAALPVASVIDKLKAHRDAKSGNETFTLPETGVVVSFPKFRSHGAWSHALRMAKNKVDKAQVLYVCKVVTFDGQKLTGTDYNKFIPMEDSTELLSRIFGGADEDDGEISEGEDQTTST